MKKNDSFHEKGKQLNNKLDKFSSDHYSITKKLLEKYKPSEDFRVHHSGTISNKSHSAA